MQRKAVLGKTQTDIVHPRAKAMLITGHKSVSGFYAAIKDGDVPAPIPVGKKSVGWLDSELAKRQQQKIAERDARLAAEAKAKAKADADAFVDSPSPSPSLRPPE